MTGGSAQESAADPVAHVNSVVTASGSSFLVAMRLLPAEKRAAMYALYAFCREVDDIADEPGEAADKRRRLGAWRDEIGCLFAGSEPRLPVARALVGAVERYGLRQADFLALLEGMEMDAADSVRLADVAALEHYCDRVACAVGRLSNRIFGIDPAAGDAVADALGQALQLTNILRDLDEDAGRDRLYLPAALLRAHGITETDAMGVLAHPALSGVCDEVAAMAERRFAEAEVALGACDRRPMRPAVIMMEMYRRILARLIERGWRRLAEPVGVSRLEKLWILARHGMI